MKILFILENTIADLHGGTEVSSFHLARLLRKRKIEVEEWTPYKKRKSMYFYTAFLFQLWIFFLLLCKCVKYRPQILHIQGKYLIPQAVLTGKLLKIPTVVTIRDYIVVCPIGLCLFQVSKRHGFDWYITKEIPKFLDIYHPSENMFKKIIRTGLMIKGWFISKYLKWWLGKADKVIVVSGAAQEILKENGIKSQIVYNTFDTGIYKDFLQLTKDSPLGKNKKNILFVGKPSYGKGYDLFQSLSRNKLFKSYNFKTIGGKSKLGYLDTLKEIEQALAVVVPSRWPEPFGRVALESVTMDVPVLTTNMGGLPEIIENENAGYVCNPEINSLTVGLRKIIKNNVKLRQIIKERKRNFSEKFGADPINAHINLYDEII